MLGVPGNVKWTSTDSSVAEVSSKGKVTAKKAGKATIRAKANGKVYRCKVTVKKPALSKKKLTISIGQTAKIRLYGTKIQKVKSSNPKVAKITKKGEVTGRSKGRATLTITGKNNKNYKCKVTVIDSTESSGDNKESSGDHKDTAGNDEDDSGDNKDVATGSEEPAGDNKDPVVSFVTYSNYAIPEKVYAKGSKLGELPSSSKLNYIFAGWYYDEALTSPVSVNDEVTKDLTLYAKYRESSELAYEENASSCVESDVSDSFTISIHSDEAIALKDANCSITIENITNPGSDEPMALSGSGENFKLAFTENGFDPGASYKVVLSDERLHFVGAPEAVREFDFTAHAEEVNHMQYTDTVIYLKASDVSDITINGKPAEDFSISLFSTGKDGEAEGKQEGTFSSQKKLKVGDTVVLYDGVRPDQRTIDTPSEKCGDVAYIEITKANGENYSFEQAEAENVIFTPDMLPINTDLDKDKTDEMDASVTLYAVFGHSYHITYGNLSDAQMPQDAVDSFTADCAPITLSEPKKDRTGYTFAGWYLSQDFERNTKIDTITPETMRRNITVYAKWKANPYVIKFDANLKSGSAGATQLCTYDQSATLKAFSELGFMNPGYAFMGWTIEQSSGRVDYQDNQDIKNLVSQGSITLYAVWSEITYMITYIYGDGSQTSGNLGTYTINSADIQLEAPGDIVEGYQFLGWYDDEIDSYVTTIQHGTYGNRILVAKWAHGGIFEIAYDRTTGEGESIYRIIRHIPEHAQVTTDVQNVYYRTENGTAIGGTAKEVNFLHAGGPEQFVIFNQTDGDGSYKEIKVQKENSATAFTPNGSAQYPAASMVARVSETAPEKYYFVKVTDVLSTQGNCQGILGEQTRVRRVIPFDESRVVDISGLGKEYVHENTELLSADHKVTAGDHFSYSHKLNEILPVFATLRTVDREYIEDTIGYYDYYLTADVREAYDGYQEVEFSTGAGYLQYEFEIKPGSTCKDWQIATRMPAPGINQGQVKKFELTSSNSNGISQIQDTTGYKVRIDKSSDKFVVEFGAHGSLQDDWHIKNIKEYLQPVDKKNAKQVSIAPMAFGKYKKGEEITIAVVMNELIRDYTSQEDLTGALNTIGIPVGSSTLHDIEETKGTNVIYIDAVLKDDFEVTVDFNEKIISNTSLLGGTVTDLSGNTGSLQ